MLIKAIRHIILSTPTVDESHLVRSYFAHDSIIDVDAQYATALIGDGEAEAYVGSALPSNPYKIERIVNPAAPHRVVSANSTADALPTDANGYLKNDGSGGLTWVPMAAITGNTSVVTDNGDGTYTHDDGDGNTVTISAVGVPAALVPPASGDAVGDSGASTKYAREDHKHPAQGVSGDSGNSISMGADGLHYFREAITSLAWNAITRQFQYTNETGTTVNLDPNIPYNAVVSSHYNISTGVLTSNHHDGSISTVQLPQNPILSQSYDAATGVLTSTHASGATSTTVLAVNPVVGIDFNDTTGVMTVRFSDGTQNVLNIGTP